MELKQLFSPIKIGNMEIKNRIVMPAMGTFYTTDETLTDQLRHYYLRRAKGGVGLMIVGPMAIDKLGGGPFLLGMEEDRFIAPMKELATELHKEPGLKVAAQLYHAGRYAFSFLTGEKSISASAVYSKFSKDTPREMTLQDIKITIDNFVSASLRVKECGFDAVEILSCTGYLLCQFLSPVTNQRTDEYGGSFENRMRFPLEVISAVREAVGKDFNIITRVAGHDYIPGSLTNKEARVFCKELEHAGVNAINVTGGWHETRVPQLTSNVPRGAYVYLARGIKESVSIPVFASNRLGNPFLADKVLCEHSADMICMARPLLTDPDLPNKAKEGRFDEIIHCISCNQACFDYIFLGKAICCIANPVLGREWDEKYQPRKAENPKNILVVGGGPAGLKAALTASKRGHKVQLWEKEDKLGGQIKYAQLPAGKGEFSNIAEDLVNQLKYTDVEIFLQTEATKEKIENESFDTVVVATGATPIKPTIPGIDKPHVLNALDVLEDPAITNKNVVIIGGSSTGLETALNVAKVGTIDAEVAAFLIENEAEESGALFEGLTHGTRAVTVVEMLPKLGEKVGKTFRWSLLQNLRRHGVELMVETKVIEIKDDHIVVENERGSKKIPAETVIYAVGVSSQNELFNKIKENVKEAHLIGDAKSPRKIMEAISEGYEIGLKI